MVIRSFRESDMNQLYEIYSKFYQHEFNFNEFCTTFLQFFVIEEQGQIISAGGVRTIAESVVITNKDISVRKRREALYKMLEANTFICGNSGHRQLHAFIQDKSWQDQLIKIGFRVCKGTPLVIDVE